MIPPSPDTSAFMSAPQDPALKYDGACASADVSQGILGRPRSATCTPAVPLCCYDCMCAAALQVRHLRSVKPDKQHLDTLLTGDSPALEI